MFIKYKKNYEKIAMGLLSFMPEEKDLKKLQATMKAYETEDHRQLLLWKDEEIIGLAGLDLSRENAVKICHLTVNPSFRAQGVGRAMIRGLRNQFPDKEIIPVETISAFFDKCSLDETDEPEEKDS